jgi:pimeloyl-ACP methyl ester carboxylesterase
MSARLFFTDEGAGDSPLLLIHGVGGDSNDWIWQLPAWREHHRVIAPDLRGHGASEVPDSGYAPADYQGDLIALLESLEVGPVVAVGHSLGAVLASNLARERPDLLRGAVLLDPTYGDDPGRREPVAQLVRRLDAEADVRGVADALATRGAPDAPAHLVTWHRRRTLATPAHVLTQTLIGLHDSPDQVMNRPDVDPLLRERAVPLLVFHALPGKAAWEETLQTDPRSRVVDWTAGGHWMHHDQPEAISAEVLGWVATL